MTLEYSRSRPPFDPVPLLSWMVLIAALTCVLGLGWYIPHDREQFRATFIAFHMEIGSVAKLIFSVPDVSIQIGAVILAVFLLTLQFIIRSKITLALLHLFVIGVFFIAFVVYHEAMSGPMHLLFQGLGVPSHWGRVPQ